MMEVNENIEEGRKVAEEQEKEVLALEQTIGKAMGKLTQMEGDMVSQEEMEKLEVFIQKVTSKAGTVEEKIERAAQKREADISALKKRVTDNEDHIDEVDESLSDIDMDIASMVEIMQEVDAAQKNVADDVTKKV